MPKKRTPSDVLNNNKKLFVRIEEDPDDSYFIAFTDISHFDDGETIGIYELKEIKTVELKASLK